jgi:hypothetical protein
MAARVLTNAKVVIGAYDMTNLANKVTVDGDAQMVEVTGFGDTSRRFVKSIRNWTVSVDYKDDFTDNGLNEMLDTSWRSTSPVAVTVRVDRGAAISATNPEWQGNCWLSTVPLFNASFGEASSGTLRMQGDGELTRAVA